MKTLFHDDVLRFLYRSEMFQQLEEEEQVAFLDTFARDEQFAKSVAVAVDFQHQLGTMEATVPEIGQVDGVKSFAKKNYAKQDGNITFFPFGEKLDLAAPLVVVMDTSLALQQYDDQVKGLVLPLLELCTQQQRDCVVLVNEEVLVFPHGQLIRDAALCMQHSSLVKPHPIAHYVATAMQIFDRYVAKEEAELLFMTADAVCVPHELVQKLKAAQIELAAIALNSTTFEAAETTPFDKVFFPNDELSIL